MMLGWIFGNLTMMLVCPIIPIRGSITPLVNILETATIHSHCRHSTARETSCGMEAQMNCFLFYLFGQVKECRMNFLFQKEGVQVQFVDEEQPVPFSTNVGVELWRVGST